MRPSIIFSAFFLLIVVIANSQEEADTMNRFKYIEVKSNYGAYLYSDNALGQAGLLDQGYGAVSVKLGWQPTDSNGWASRLGYPSYGIGLYSGFLGDAKVYGNPNAVYAFINFHISDAKRRNIFSIEPSIGLTYNLNPFDSEENPVNEAIGARAAVYFNIDFGFAYKFTRELDLLYGIDFSHFSNGSTFQPNNGLNLYGINLGLRYYYNAEQLKRSNDFYTTEVLQARFDRPQNSERLKIINNALSLFVAGGVAQRDEDQGSNTVFGVFSGVLDYEHAFNDMHGITGGIDLFYDNRLRNLDVSERLQLGAHIGYDFMFYKFAVKFQLGTYLGDDKGKGGFFMRPALRYQLNKKLFAQIGLKTLNGGAADYIEYGIGFYPFNW